VFQRFSTIKISQPGAPVELHLFHYCDLCPNQDNNSSISKFINQHSTHSALTTNVKARYLRKSNSIMVRIFLLLLWAATIAMVVAERSQKNIIFFMTDDQDVTANSIDPTIMPRLNRLFREEGMEFTNYYVPTGLCCPSRATILRGQYCHNTKVFDNGDFNNSTYKSGGWAKFVDTGLEEETFPTLLQSAGYETAMIGKYMNGYNLYDDDAPLHKPPGFDHWMGLLKCFNFYGPIFSDNGKRILKTNSTVYQTDFIRDWALDFLRNKRDPSKVCSLLQQ
jgi:hypothetical protein